MALAGMVDQFETFVVEGALTLPKIVSLGPELRRRIEGCAHCDMVIDLSSTPLIDSSGIALLVNARKLVETGKRRLYVLKPTREVRQILEQVNLHKVITVVESAEQLGEHRMSGDIDRYRAMTIAEGDQLRLLCSCPVCGSDAVSGYLVDTSEYRWRWEEDCPILPSSFRAGDGIGKDVLSLIPIVCQECLFSSVSPGHFHFGRNGRERIPAALGEVQRAGLHRELKRRKTIMEAVRVPPRQLFSGPRIPLAAMAGYLLCASCTKSLQPGTMAAFNTGKFYYLASAYAPQSMASQYLSDSRAWTVRVLSEKYSYTPLELSMALFFLVNACKARGNHKEARRAVQELESHLSGADGVNGQDISRPGFWFTQTRLIVDGLV